MSRSLGWSFTEAVYTNLMMHRRGARKIPSHWTVKANNLGGGFFMSAFREPGAPDIQGCIDNLMGTKIHAARIELEEKGKHNGCG